MLKNFLIGLFLGLLLICSDGSVSASVEDIYIEDFVKARHPTLAFESLFRPVGIAKEQDIVGIFRDEKDLTVEHFYHAKKTPDSFEEKFFPIKADSSRPCGFENFLWIGLDDVTYYYSTKNKEFINLDHPERVWNDAQFDDSGALVFTQTIYEGWDEFWTNASGSWNLLGRSKNSQQQMILGLSSTEDPNKPRRKFRYLCSYHEEDNTATLQLVRDGVL